MSGRVLYYAFVPFPTWTPARLSFCPCHSPQIRAVGMQQSPVILRSAWLDDFQHDCVEHRFPDYS